MQGPLRKKTYTYWELNVNSHVPSKHFIIRSLYDDLSESVYISSSVKSIKTTSHTKYTSHRNHPWNALSIILYQTKDKLAFCVQDTLQILSFKVRVSENTKAEIPKSIMEAIKYYITCLLSTSPTPQYNKATTFCSDELKICQKGNILNIFKTTIYIALLVK